jgi:hypothetical protein
MSLTPIQIALLALAHETPCKAVCVWGSWQKAALGLGPALTSLGTRPGTREIEWQTLRGRQRRGKSGRLVHLYGLAPSGAALAARCAWAVAHKPADRQHVTWRDVPTEIPNPPPGRRCGGCGCVPGKPCAVKLPNGCGDGVCVSAGVFGFRQCTACQLMEAA